MNQASKQRILDVLNRTDDELNKELRVFTYEVEGLKSKLKEDVNALTLKEVNSHLDDFKKKIDLQPLLTSISTIESTFQNRSQELATSLSQSVEKLTSFVSKENQTTVNSSLNIYESLKSDMSSFRSELSTLVSDTSKQIRSFKKEMDAVKQITPHLETKMDVDMEFLRKNTYTNISKIREIVSNNEKSIESKNSDIKRRVDDVNYRLDEYIKDVTTRFSRLGGGGISRRIQIQGVDISKKYNDINYLNGISAVDNDLTKQVDITLTGGGTGFSGTVISETPQGLIDGINTDYTTSSLIISVLGLWINGQYILPSEYTVTQTGFSMVTPLDTSLSGTAFTIVYVATSTIGFVETPSGLINSINTVYTTQHTITTVISLTINGEFIHPAEYVVSGSGFTMITPLDSTLSGTPFIINYV